MDKNPIVVDPRFVPKYDYIRPQGEIKTADDNLLDRIVYSFRDKVPESYRSVLPGVSDIEDLAYFREQFKQKGNVKGKSLATTSLLAPVVGSKVIKQINIDNIVKNFSKKYGKKVKVVNTPAWDEHMDLKFLDEYDNELGRFTGEITGNNIKAIGIGVPETMRRKNIASNIYRTMSEEAGSFGGTLMSEGPFGFTLKDPLTNKAIAPAKELWDNLVSKGEAKVVKKPYTVAYEMTKQKYADGGKVVANRRSNFANGGQVGDFLKENKEGIIGGLQLAGGIGSMFVPGLQGFGASLIASGATGVAGELLDGNTQEQINQQQMLIPQPSRPASMPTFQKGGKIADPKKVKRPLYDLDRAIELGYVPDSTGHLPSRDFLTGRILKSPAHPTFGKAIKGDRALGYTPLVDINGNVYTVSPEDIPQEGPFSQKVTKEEFPDGGRVGRMVDVELEKDEVFRTPDGSIGAIKGNEKFSHANQGAPISLEEGTEILGKNIESTSGKSFKEMGKKLASERQRLRKLKESTKNKLTENSIKAMERKIDNRFTDLYESQEADKAQGLNPQFAKGGKAKKSTYQIGGVVTPDGVDETGLPGDPTLNNLYKESQAYYADIDPAWLKEHNIDTSRLVDPSLIRLKKLMDQVRAQNNLGNNIPNVGINPYAQPTTPRVPRTIGPQTVSGLGSSPIASRDILPNVSQPAGLFRGASPTSPVSTVNPSLAGEFIPEAGAIENLRISDPSAVAPGAVGSIADISASQSAGNANVGGNQFGFGNNNFLNTLGQLAPIGYNIAQGLRRPEEERLPQQFNQANALLANRKFNIDPMLEANRNAQAIYESNLVSSGAGTGRVGSGRLAGLSSRMRADAAAHAQKQNVENQYLAQQAQGLFGTGAAQRYVDVANLQNEAARRNFLATGAGQVSNLAQRNQLMNNLGTRDQQTLEIYKRWFPFFSKQFGDINFG
jgi:hypothetical protein